LVHFSDLSITARTEPRQEEAAIDTRNAVCYHSTKFCSGGIPNEKGIVLFAVLLFLVAVPVLAAPVTMQEGSWEVVTRINIEGVPFPMPPMKTTHCYTRKDLEDSSKTRPAAGGSGKKNECEVKDLASRPRRRLQITVPIDNALRVLEGILFLYYLP
jgi:hypothetical protein